MEKKVLVTTIVTVEIELTDKVTEILTEAGWDYTGSHEPYKIDGILKQVLHFEANMGVNNLCSNKL